MFIKGRKPRQNALLGGRFDDCIPACMRWIKEFERYVGGAQIPEANEIVQIIRAANVETSVIPAGPNGIVLAQAMTREIA